MSQRPHLALYGAILCSSSFCGGGVQAAVTVLLEGEPSHRAGFYVTIGYVPDHIETFESVPMGLGVSVPSFSQQGVSYTALTASPLVVAPAGCCGQFAPALTPTGSAVLTGNGFDDMRIVFASPVLAASFDIYTNGLGPLTITYYSGASAIASSTFNGRAQIRASGFYSSMQAISSIVFTDTGGETVNAGIDNLDWVSTPVPEPGTWALWFGGLAALRMALRRR